MTPNNNEQKFTLTKQQQGLWIEWKLHPDNTSYNTCVKVKLRGTIDVERLSEALKDIVQYFESLRVYFTEESGIPYQCIKDQSSYFLDYQDISIEGQEETPILEQQGLDFLSKTLNTPVDLKSFPLVRAALMKVADQTYYFIGMVPHMISDGRSAILFLESLSIAYNHGFQGLKDAYDASSKTWYDFHHDQRNQFNAEKHAVDKAHWQNRLANANHYFDYSYGRNNIAKDTKQGHRVYFDIPPELASAIKAHTSINKTTLFNVMVCAFGIFIHRYFALTDILVGFPISIRPAGYKHLFGFFVNIVPIRVDLDGDPSYQELLARVSKSRKEDKRHQKFPALDIVGAVRENVNDFDGQLFNLSMAQTVSRLFNLELGDVITEPLESEYNDVNDDLSLSYELLEDGIGLWFEYRTSMFDEKFIHQGIEHIRQILEQMTQSPEIKLSEFKLLNREQEAELADFSTGEISSESIQQTNLVELFEYQVSNTPTATALKQGNESISYQQLNQRANQLARLIAAQQLSKGSAIAVCLNPGAELIVSLLAVMKAACHYVPIAPDYPKERLQFIINDSHCALIICDTQTSALCSNLSTELINLEQQRSLIDGQKLTNLALPVVSETRAYIIYTSGSTGVPKGVPITHGNLLPRLQCLQQEIPLDASDVMLQSTDYSFDVSVAEIFWPLTSGASLALTTQGQSKYPEQIIAIMQKSQTTVSCMVPSMLNSILSISKHKQLASIKYLLAAGEVLSPNTVNRFYQSCNGELFNFYGPTEATIYSTFYRCGKYQTLPAIPIGKPLLGTETYILDSNLNRQAKGVAGELYLAGASITSGYINRSELNDSAFVDDPFTAPFTVPLGKVSSKLYRTGDLARYLDDGNIDYLGRNDSQVKIRGYRIEIAEIESVISTLEGIKDNAVMVDPEQRLIAYIVTDDTQLLSQLQAQLKTHLAEKLPNYMMPSLFLELDEIPKSQSGKIQHSKLPAVASLVKSLSEYAAPVTDMEKQFVRIWASILKIPENKIGIHDSFFELGGDSLMAIQFASAAEEQNLTLNTSSLFDNRTISQLVSLIDESEKVACSQQSIVGEYPLTARQYKFFDDKFINQDHWNRQFSFDVIKKISVSAFEKAFIDVLRHHDALRVYFTQKDNAEWVQISRSIADLETATFYHDLSSISNEQQQTTMRRLISELHTGIRLSSTPLIKAIYFKLDESTGSMVIVSHHLLLDMVSSRIVFEDLMRAYEFRRRGLKPKLANKTSALKQWTEYLAGYSEKADFSDALAYWGNFQAESMPIIPVDFDVNDKKNIEASAKTLSFVLSNAATHSLVKDIPANQGLKIQDLLLAALLNTTRKWTSDNNLTVNVCGHGRQSGNEAINLSRTVGWVNTVFPIKFDASAIENNNLQQLVNIVLEQMSEVPDNNMEYNILRYINKHPDILKHKSPEIFFNYVGQIDAIIPDEIAFKPSTGLQAISEIDGKNHLCYLLYFEAGVTAGQLNIRLTYSDHYFDDTIIAKLSTLLMNSIYEIVELY